MNDHPEIIQTFTQSPSVEITTDELTEAEDQILEKETKEVDEDAKYREEHSEKIELTDPDESVGDSSEDDTELDNGENIPQKELMMMDRYRLLSTAILSANLDYGTPAGTDDSQQCAGCSNGTEDAADAAIIDSSISPASPTEEEEPEDLENDNENAFNSTFKAVFNQSVDLLYLKHLMENENSNITKSDIDIARRIFGDIVPSNEAWVDVSHDSGWDSECKIYYHSIRSIFIRMVHSVWHISKELAKGLVKITKVLNVYLPKTYRKFRTKFDKLTKTSERLMILWESKLNKYVLRADEEKLRKYKVKGFKYDDWMKISKVLLDVYEMVSKSARTLIDDSSASDKNMRELVDKIQSIGISTSADSKKVDITELLKRKIVSNAVDMGFTPSKMESVMYVVKRLSAFFDYGRKLNFEKLLTSACRAVNQTTEKISTKVGDSKEESSDELKTVAHNVLQSNLKIKYVSSVLQTVNEIAEMCIYEIHYVGVAYEKSLAPTFEKVESDESY